MKYERFENASTDKIWNMDGYVYGPKTIKGAYSALRRKIEQITGDKDLIGQVIDPINSKQWYDYLCKTQNCDINNAVTGECMRNCFKQDELYMFYKHPEFDYWYRMTIELIDDETNFWYIDFGMSREA